MIKEVSGDILLSSAKAIAHSVAPMDHFETGLALSLRERYPAMVKDFRHFCHTHHPSPGEIFNWGGAEGLQIVSLLVQEPSTSNHSHGLPGRASIHNLDKAMKNLVKWIQNDQLESLAIPKIATGVGGLDWEEVKPVLYKHLDHLIIPVFLYSKFVKGEKAKEM